MKAFWRRQTTGARLARAALLTAGLFIGLELVLRLATGRPYGTFNGLFAGGHGFYPENRTIQMTWGPIPYTIQTNSLGLRGAELALPKPPGVTRVVMIGDSHVDGYFVDNPDTLPEQTRAALGRPDAEVVNAAFAGGSLDKQLAILRVALDWEPDAVVLVFTPNDIADLAGRDLEDLLATPLPRRNAQTAAAEWAWTRTASGEALLDAVLRAGTTTYGLEGASGPGGRYDIPGGADHAANIRIFDERFGGVDGRVLEVPFSPETEALVANYLALLEEFARLCREAGVPALLVYVPAYPQVYSDAASMEMRDRLEAAAARLGLEFLDLTPALRLAAQDAILYLAPLDFHPNPDGYAAMAAAIAEKMEELGW
ncbi:MAG: SGNH/GDSL hydrolase family protein [Chloroflexi bacterium]|nr:SGNH/GDSL hydrolase family protein [Chloroflexota bacterium]